MTARDLIKGSLRLLGAISTGETPSADEITDGLTLLNEMLDSWSNENLLVYKKDIEKFTLVPGTQSYSIGVGGNFNTANPIKLELAMIELQDSPDLIACPMDVITVHQWSEIADKSLESAIPTRIYLEKGHPLSTVYLWPKPSVANKLVLTSWKPLSTLATSNTEVILPPGYLRALRYNLALELAPEYGKEPSGSLISSAQEAKENIKRTNIVPHFMDATGPVGRSGVIYDIYKGDY